MITLILAFFLQTTLVEISIPETNHRMEYSFYLERLGTDETWYVRKTSNVHEFYTPFSGTYRITCWAYYYSGRSTRPFRAVKRTQLLTR